MTFVGFLRRLIERHDLFMNEITCVELVSREPLGALHTLIQEAVRDAGIYTLTVHDIYAQDFSIEAALGMSFCGEQASICYMAAESDGVQKRVPNAIMRYLSSYVGHHKLVYICSPEDTVGESSTRRSIIIDDVCSEELYRLLVILMHGRDIVRKSVIYDAAVARVRKLSISDVMLLARYEGLLGQSTDAFIVNWLDTILAQSPSLFTLAQYFFARDIQRFYRAWTQLNELYPPEFWILFWAEQFWQGIVFITLAHSQPAANAGKVTKGLPFSFMRQDYRKHTVQQLSRALEDLYELDTRVKQGGITTIFEPIFAVVLGKE